MYAALWRVLPGPIWLRIVFVLVLVAAVLFAVSTWVFPWIDQIITPQEATVGQ
ncbi:hypothetical protein [Glaciibacter flavus]|uniref:hypothetical protein n=1 Tax=Orlajensenia flava TaxID=2565934 RepID=UPI003B000E3D